MEMLILKIILFLHGTLGAVVLLMVEKTKDFCKALRMIAVSGVCSAIIAPALANRYEWKTEVTYAGALLVGIACWKLLQGLIVLLNQFSKDPTGIIELLWKRKT